MKIFTTFFFLIGIIYISVAQKVKVTFQIDIRNSTYPYDYSQFTDRYCVVLFPILNTDTNYLHPKNKILPANIKSANYYIHSVIDTVTVGDTIQYLFGGQNGTSMDYDLSNQFQGRCEQLTGFCGYGGPGVLREFIVPAKDTVLPARLFGHCGDSSLFRKVDFSVKALSGDTIGNIYFKRDAIGRAVGWGSTTIKIGNYLHGSVSMVKGDTVNCVYYTNARSDYLIDSSCMAIFDIGRFFRKQSFRVWSDTALSAVVVGDCDTDAVYGRFVARVRYDSKIYGKAPKGIGIEIKLYRNGAWVHNYPAYKGPLRYLEFSNNIYYDTIDLPLSDSIKYQYYNLSTNLLEPIPNECLAKFYNGYDMRLPLEFKTKLLVRPIDCYGSCTPCPSKHIKFKVRAESGLTLNVAGNFNGYSNQDLTGDWTLVESSSKSSYRSKISSSFMAYTGDTLEYYYCIKGVPETVPQSCSFKGHRIYIVGTDTLQWVSPHDWLNGCDDSAYWFAGMASELSTGIAIYPNPTKDLLNIDNPQYQKMQLRIYNLLGETLLTKSSADAVIEIPVSHLSKGIYIVEVQKNDCIYTTKVLKE